MNKNKIFKNVTGLTTPELVEMLDVLAIDITQTKLAGRLRSDTSNVFFTTAEFDVIKKHLTTDNRFSHVLANMVHAREMLDIILATVPDVKNKRSEGKSIEQLALDDKSTDGCNLDIESIALSMGIDADTINSVPYSPKSNYDYSKKDDAQPQKQKVFIPKPGYREAGIKISLTPSPEDMKWYYTDEEDEVMIDENDDDLSFLLEEDTDVREDNGNNGNDNASDNTRDNMDDEPDSGDTDNTNNDASEVTDTALADNTIRRDSADVTPSDIAQTLQTLNLLDDAGDYKVHDTSDGEAWDIDYLDPVDEDDTEKEPWDFISEGIDDTNHEGVYSEMESLSAIADDDDIKYDVVEIDGRSRNR